VGLSTDDEMSEVEDVRLERLECNAKDEPDQLNDPVDATTS
jgi:hypothetical protein